MRLVLCILVSITLFFSKYADSRSVNFDDILTNAENLRSQNPKKFQQSLKLLLENKNKLSHNQQLYLRYLQGYQASFNGELDKATKLFKSIINDDAPENIKVKAQLTLVNSLALAKNWVEGMQELNSLVKVAETIDDIKLKQRAYTVIAVTYNLYEKFEHSLYYAQILDLESFPPRTRCFINSVINEAKLKLGVIKGNNRLITEAIRHCENSNEQTPADMLRVYHAQHFYDVNEHTIALTILTQLEKRIETVIYPRLQIELYTTLAKTHLALSNFDLATTHANNALAVDAIHNATKPLADSYMVLYSANKSINKLDIALNHLEKYIAAERTYLDEVRAKELAFQLSEHQSLQQQSEINLLNNQNELLKVEQSLATAEAKNSKLIASLMGLIIAILCYFGYRSWRTQKRLKELAEYDALTGIYNRGHFAHVAKSAIQYCENTEQELSIIMFDLDWFKSINDNFGHGAGDWALKATADAVKAIGRNNDIFARIGGEEFCLILTGCSVTQAQSIAEDCRKAIETIDTTDSGFEFNITASFGVTDAKRSSYNMEKLLADADAAAYQSKHEGRNRISIYRNELAL